MASSETRIARSAIWRHFQKSEPTCNKIAICNICKQHVNYKSTISNLKKHMNRHHPMVLFVTSPVCNKNLDTDTAQPLSTPLHPEYPGKMVETSPTPAGDPQSSGLTRSVVTPGRTSQLPMSRYMEKKLTESEKRKLDNVLVNMIIEDFQPFSIVEDRGFRKFVKALNPNYELPSRKRISANMIPAKYEEAKNRLKILLGKVDSCCITTDCWTSCTTDSYIAVTAHFIHEGKFISSLLTCQMFEDSHTSVHLASTLKEIFEEWGITEKIVLAVSDNAKNIIGALKLLQLKFLGCAAHKLNLIVEKALDDKIVAPLLLKVKKIVTHFHCSSLSWQKLQECQRKEGMTPKKLLNSVPTRWNSTYLMLKRFTLLEVPLKTALAHISADLPCLTSREWQIARDLTNILEPFQEVTLFISKENYPPASSLIVVVRGLIDILNTYLSDVKYDAVKPVLEVLLTGVMDKDRFGCLENSKTLAVSTFLDPRYKMDGFSNVVNAESAKSAVKSLLMKKAAESAPKPPHSVSQVEEVDSNVPISLFNCFLRKKISSTVAIQTPETSAIHELRRYLTATSAPLASDPIHWWFENRLEFPLMSKVALERLCIVSTSVPCEQLFSKAGLIISDRRSRLTPLKAKMLVFLNANKNISDLLLNT